MENVPINRLIRLTLLILLLPIILAVIAPNMMVTTVIHDIAVPLGAGWRVLQGQIPNRDFHEPVGPIYPWVEALGLWIGGGSGKSVVYTECFIALFWSPWIFWAASKRLDLWTGLVFCCFTLGLALAPSDFDDTYLKFTHLADYNRISWIALCLITLLLFLPPKHSTRLTVWMDGALLSVAFAVLLLTKMPLAVFGAILLFLMPIFQPVPRFLGWFCGIIGAILALVVCSLFGSVSGYFLDLLRALHAAAGTASGFRWGRLLINTFFNIPSFVAVGATLWLCKNIQGSWSRGLASLIFLGLGLLVSVQDAGSGIPCFMVITLCLYEQARRASLHQSPIAAKPFQTHQKLAMALVVSSIFPLYSFSTDWVSMVFAAGNGFRGFGPPLIDNPRSPYYHVTTRWDAHPGSEHIPNMPLPPLSADPHTDPNRINRSEIGTVWSGIYTMMQPFVTPKTRIWTIGFSNPFPLAFKAKSPVGDNTWWDFGRTYSDKPDSHPPFSVILCNSDLVVDYQTLRADDQPDLRILVEPLLSADFVPVAQSPWAIIWKRKHACRINTRN